MRRTGVTHLEFDLDGGSCLRFLERKGQINEIIFDPAKVEKITDWDSSDALFFCDIDPENKPSKIKPVIYDHHKIEAKITAFDILIREQGLGRLDKQKVCEWQRLVYASDNEKCNDSMDIHHLFSKMHYLISDPHEVYKEWFVPIFDSFFDGVENIPQGSKVLKETILEFFRDNPESLIEDFIERENWLGKLEKPKEKLKEEKYFFRNMLRFISYMKPKVAKQWVLLSLKALDKHQTSFSEDLQLIKKSGVEICGDTLIVSQVTVSRTFDEAAGYYMNKSDKFEIPPQIKQRIPDDRSKIWFIIKVSPQENNFQIFCRGENKKIIPVVFDEMIKAIRAEILVRKGGKVPSREILCKDGKLEGTEPLFYNKKTNPQILWGSLKHKVPPATIFGKTAYEIKENLEEIIMNAVDDNYFPYECNPINCCYCSMHPWNLEKCERKRKEIEVHI